MGRPAEQARRTLHPRKARLVTAGRTTKSENPADSDCAVLFLHGRGGPYSDISAAVSEHAARDFSPAAVPFVPGAVQNGFLDDLVPGWPSG